jgi:hypothetical protein
MLRAYNAEADSCVRTLRPHTLQTTITRLGKSRDTIARLGKTMNIEIDDKYHRLRLLELELTADYLVKQEEEKDRVRVERERQREEEAARREFEREKTRLMKEQAQYSIALAQLRAAGDWSLPRQPKPSNGARARPLRTISCQRQGHCLKRVGIDVAAIRCSWNSIASGWFLKR